MRSTRGALVARHLSVVRSNVAVNRQSTQLSINNTQCRCGSATAFSTACRPVAGSSTPALRSYACTKTHLGSPKSTTWPLTTQARSAWVGATAFSTRRLAGARSSSPYKCVPVVDGKFARRIPIAASTCGSSPPLRAPEGARSSFRPSRGDPGSAVSSKRHCILFASQP